MINKFNKYFSIFLLNEIKRISDILSILYFIKKIKIETILLSLKIMLE
jgi:hypothetical protein